MNVIIIKLGMSGEQTDYLDWDKLRVFSAVAELRSLTAAAKRLGESTPTVSRKIDDLEKRLNCDLLIRSPRGVELTEAGRIVARHAEAINQETNSIWNEVCNLDIEGSGWIRIAARDGIAAHWLTRAIPAFQREHPRLGLEMTIQPQDPDLLSGEADLTFAFTEPRHRDLLSIRLGVLHYMLYASPDYLREHGRPQSLFDLQDHLCLMHIDYVNQVDSWAPRGQNLRKAISFVVSTNSGSVLRETCAAGGGIALMPSYIAEIDPRVEPLDLQEIAPIQFWLVYTHRLQRLSRGRMVVDWIRKQFSQGQTPWFQDSFVHPKTVLTRANDHEQKAV